MRTRITLAVSIASLALLAVACGGGSGNRSTSGTRRVEIEMQDIAFSPSQVTVHDGETVEFVFHNAGRVAHDAFIGDEHAQDGHEMEMRGSGDMHGMDHHGGGDSGGINVDPGATGTLTHTFHAGDQLLVGCHEEGHYAAGMKISIDVA